MQQDMTGDHTHAGASAVAAIIISNAHTAVKIGTIAGAAEQVVRLVPITSIAI